MDIDPGAVKFFTIPLSYFTVIFSLLLIQWGMVNIIGNSLGKISFSHRKLSGIMNWWGVFIHELSHAVTAIITLNKVTEFKVTSKGGYVVHENSRSGFIQWLAVQLISISPAFVPPLIAALLLRYLGYLSFQDIVFNAGEPVSIISSLYLDLIPYIIRTVGWLFVNLDYTKAENILLLLVLTFSFSFAYPSSVKSKKSTQGDMQSFFELLVKFPGYTILFILLCFLSFWILFKFNATLFLNVLTFLILLPVLSMFGLILIFLFIRLINLFDNTSRIHIIVALSATILVYAAVTQLALKQYLINIISIAILAGTLMLLKK